MDRLLDEHFHRPISDFYASNLFPFIKPGSLSAPIPQADYVRAAKEFALPQIDIIVPRLVIALGKRCFNSLRRACEGKPAGNIEEAIGRPVSYGGSTIWCQAHTSPQGQNTRNRGGIDRVSKDWKTMADWFENCNQHGWQVLAYKFAFRPTFESFTFSMYLLRVS